VALYVWLFECARCHQFVLLCTRCLGRRRFCDPCGDAERAKSVRESGDRYQQTAEGRRKHMLRQRRYRAGRREKQLANQPPMAPPPGNAGPTATEPPAEVHPAAFSPAVTHQSAPPSSLLDAKRLTRAPQLAAYRAAAQGAEGDSDETQRPAEFTTACVAGEGETTGPACQRERPWRAQAADQAQRAVAAVLAQLQHRGPRGPPVAAVCSCCGRAGELVAYDGQPRIVRGCEQGREPG
jgi:hypothetical protein